MSKRNSLRNLCELFRLLSDETRLRLLMALRSGEQHVNQLCKTLRLPQPTVSHHLSLLRIHGLVKNRREGKLVFYAVSGQRHNRAVKAIEGLLA